MADTVIRDSSVELMPPEGSLMAFVAGFFLATRIVLVFLAVRVLGADARTGAEASLALGFLLLIVVGFHSLGDAKRSFGSMLRLPSIRWVMLFLAVSCCSLAWSRTVSLPSSIVFWCGMAADVAIVVLLLRAGSVVGRARSLMKGFVIGACCIALIAWIMPAQADLRLGDEDFFNTNQIGNLCAFAFFWAQYLMRRKEGKWGWAALFMALTLLRSLSKTTLVAFVLSQSFLVIQDRSLSRRTKILLTTAVMLIVVIFWGLFEAYYDIYTTAGNQAETLTGRTAIWLYVADESVQSPWIGHGFDSMWKVVPPFGSDAFEARHAENEVLQQFYAYGVGGVVMLVGLYWSLYATIRKRSRAPVKIVFVSMLLFIVIRGLAEAEPFDLLLPLWAIVLISLLVDAEETMTEENTAVYSQQLPQHAAS